MRNSPSTPRPYPLRPPKSSPQYPPSSSKPARVMGQATGLTDEQGRQGGMVPIEFVLLLGCLPSPARPPLWSPAQGVRPPSAGSPATGLPQGSPASPLFIFPLQRASEMVS